MQMTNIATTSTFCFTTGFIVSPSFSAWLVVSLVYKTIHLLNARDRCELQRSDRSGHERQQTALPTPEQKGRFASRTESDNAQSGHSGRDLSAQKLRGVLQP